MKDFHCLAGNCRHTCCAGWDIEIDKQAFSLYKSLPGKKGDEIRSSIDVSGEVPCFKTDGHRRCLNLCDDGLCRIIKYFGEDALCDICYDHPRFRNYFSDRVEIGAGLCCEAAAQLILGRTAPFSLTLTDTDPVFGCVPGVEESRLLEAREKLLDTVRDRNIPLRDRICTLENTYGVHPDKEIIEKALNAMEFMDGDNRTFLLRANRDFEPVITQELEIPYEQLLCYLIFRHFNADAAGREKKTAFFILSQLRLILSAVNASGGTMEALFEAARIWSAETEYSDVNPGLIEDFC